jgi:hypothetical protein
MDRGCDLQVNDRVHGLLFSPFHTPQCLSGSYSLSFTGRHLRSTFDRFLEGLGVEKEEEDMSIVKLGTAATDEALVGVVGNELDFVVAGGVLDM